MTRRTISLGRILGIPVDLDYSWFLIFGLLTWMLAVGYYPHEFKGWPTVQYWFIGAVTAIMLFVSVLLHELGHSMVAIHYKVTVRNITLFIFGGVSQIGAEPPSANAEFWIAIAGPLVSFALAVFFKLLQPLFGAVAPLLALAEYLAYINGMLALFNLIPGFPLDGGRVLRAIIWGSTHNMRRATIIAANVGRFVAYLFIALGVWQMFTGDFANGLWIAFIGWFLESAAVAQVQQQAVQDLLAGHLVSQAMSRDYAAIPAEISVQQLVNRHIIGGGRRSFVVKQGERVVGLLTLHHLKKVPQDQWLTTTVEQAMIPVEQIKCVQPNAELWTALEEMDRDGVNQLLVKDQGQIRGMLSREDVISFMRTLRALNV